MKEYKILIGGKETTFRLDNFAEQANGSFFVCSDDTVVLSIATMSKNKREGMDFFPLVVDYEEKFYASGKIGGSRYTRREAKPTDAAITNSRLIDRAIRPVFPNGLEGVDVQIVSSCLSWDKEGDTAIMALLATSISLMISDIPFNGPVSAVRIIKKDGQFIINPSCSERDLAQMEVVYSGLKDKSGNILINMIEGEFKEASNDDIAESFRIAQGIIKELCEFQENIAKEIGKKKIVFEQDIIPEELKSEIELSVVLGEDLDQTKKDLIAFCDEKYPEDLAKKKQALNILEEMIFNKIKDDILLHQKRMDGRGVDDLRELSAEVGLLPRVHGSAIFSRGATRAFSILTLGAPGDSLTSEEMGIETEKKFIHHYNFPPYSVGEVRPLRGPSRRDIGHGALAEKALVPVIPESFPYTIRVVSEI
ncbi:MAG: polyribonucleotide nucleotidyltransferase, partial [Candidatus Pacebacteria bacterium]|nr:polyribonucleotide nucleotidyltransferase [Candidatus Paceibacterota bacterium]